MASKKMNQVEVKAIAKKIIREVNEVNTVYNESVLKSKTYLDEVKRIENQSKVKEIEEKIEKEIKIAFGSKYKDELYFYIRTNSGSKLSEKENEVRKELNDFKNKSLKEIISDHGNKYDLIVEEITIAQITVSDIQLLINSIKAKLV